MEVIGEFVPDVSHVSGSLVLGGVVVLLSLCHAIMPWSVDEAFALVPHHTVFSPVHFIPVPFLWNVLTANFFEGHLVKAAILIPWVVALARMLERLWELKAFAMHLGFTATLSGFSVFVGELMVAYRTHNHSTFFAPVRGCVGILVALAVGLRHAYPFEALPVLPRSWGLQCQHLPFALAACICVVGFFAPQWLPEWSFAPFALFYGWFYLRYLMWFPYAGAHGDPSPEFSFDSLFPRPVRPFVACAGAVAYGLGVTVAPGLLKLREVDSSLGHAIMYDPGRADCEGGGRGDGSRNGAAGRVPGVAAASSEEYDARRARALQLLDDNINSLLAAKPFKSRWSSASAPAAEGTELTVPGRGEVDVEVGVGGSAAAGGTDEGVVDRDL